MRKALSVTLREDNLLWLKGVAAATAKGSVSRVVDDLVTDARRQGRTDPSAIRSVAGTIALPDGDEGLDRADAQVRALFERSLRRPAISRQRATRRTRRRG